MASSQAVSLRTDHDFAAELMLNRVMNGQMQTSRGSTVNSASRNMATRFDATGLSYGVLAENIAVGKAVVEGTQNTVTEMRDYVKKLVNVFTAMSSDSDLQAMAQTLQPDFANYFQTQYKGYQVFQGGTNNLTLGDPRSEYMNLTDLDFSGNTASDVVTLSNAMQNRSIDLTNWKTLCENALHELDEALVRKGEQINILDNRYVMYNDLVSTYHDASDNEALNMGGSTSFLNAVS